MIALTVPILLSRYYFDDEYETYIKIILFPGLTYEPDHNAEDIFKKCRIFVFVISEDFDTTPRVTALAQELKTLCIDNKENRIIPITRDTPIPDFLNTLEPADADDIFLIRNAILLGLN